MLSARDDTSRACAVRTDSSRLTSTSWPRPVPPGLDLARRDRLPYRLPAGSCVVVPVGRGACGVGPCSCGVLLFCLFVVRVGAGGVVGDVDDVGDVGYGLA